MQKLLRQGDVMEQQSRFELINRNSRGRRYAILIKNDINFNEKLFLRYEFIESKHIGY